MPLYYRIFGTVKTELCISILIIYIVSESQLVETCTLNLESIAIRDSNAERDTTLGYNEWGYMFLGSIKSDQRTGLGKRERGTVPGTSSRQVASTSDWMSYCSRSRTPISLTATLNWDKPFPGTPPRATQCPLKVSALT